MNRASPGPPPLHLKRRLAAIGLGLFGWLAYRGLAGNPQLAERLVGHGPLAELPRLLSLLTGSVPFALAEIVVVAVLIRQGFGVAGAVRDLRSGRDQAGRTALRGGLRLAQDLGILIFLFYLLWGVQYTRPGLESRLGIPEGGAVPVAELAEISAVLVDATNSLYLELHGEVDLGVPTPRLPIRRLAPHVEEGWERAADRWDLPDRVRRAHGIPRPFLLTPVIRRLAIAGMYFPYTGEALVMGDLPGASRGKDLAHEMAHQRGIAREADANALAYLVTAQADHPHVRYSGALFLQRQFLGSLARVDPVAATRLLRDRLPGVQRDVDATRAYWVRSQGPVGTVSRQVNDAMLRSHGIPEGVANYQGSVWVIVALARREGIEAILPRGTGAGGVESKSPGVGYVPNGAEDDPGALDMREQFQERPFLQPHFAGHDRLDRIEVTGQHPVPGIGVGSQNHACIFVIALRQGARVTTASGCQIEHHAADAVGQDDRAVPLEALLAVVGAFVDGTSEGGGPWLGEEGRRQMKLLNEDRGWQAEEEYGGSPEKWGHRGEIGTPRSGGPRTTSPAIHEIPEVPPAPHPGKP